jgi:hypothetical protein
MSTFGRSADARWLRARAAELRKQGKELEARRCEKLADWTLAILKGEK